MKIYSILISLLFVVVNVHGQSNEVLYNKDSATQYIFESLELEGVDVSQPLLYGYFFIDRDSSRLQKLRIELSKDGYHFVKILSNTTDSEFTLHVERTEVMNLKTMLEREKVFYGHIEKMGVMSYDGFDVGNKDVSLPLITNDGFQHYIEGKNAKDLIKLGDRLYQREIYDKAEIVYRRCIVQNIHADTAYYRLGVILDRYHNNLTDAIEATEMAVKLNPGYLKAYFNLGAWHYDNLNFTKSMVNYQHANLLKPNDDAIIYGIAADQYALQDYEGSLKNCKSVLQLNPGNTNAQHLQKMLADKGYN